jgi:hypothetical protein
VSSFYRVLPDGLEQILLDTDRLQQVRIDLNSGSGFHVCLDLHDLCPLSGCLAMFALSSIFRAKGANGEISLFFIEQFNLDGGWCFLGLAGKRGSAPTSGSGQFFEKVFVLAWVERARDNGDVCGE